MTQLFINQLPKDMQEQIKGQLAMLDMTDEQKEALYNDGSVKGGSGNASMGFLSTVKAWPWC